MFTGFVIVLILEKISITPLPSLRKFDLFTKHIWELNPNKIATDQNMVIFCEPCLIEANIKR